MSNSIQNAHNMKKSIKSKIIDDIFKLLFSQQYCIFGGAIRDYILSGKKSYPTDFDISVNDVEIATTNIINRLNCCFNINKEEFMTRNNKHVKLYLDYKYSTRISIIIDISHKNIVGSNLDFDVNGIYMPDQSTYKLVKQINTISIIDIINKINTKKFRIIKNFDRPKCPRKCIGIEESSKKLLEYVKIMDRTCKMLCRGWSLDEQKVEEVFDPCLIKKVNQNMICDICSGEFRKYELELDCCKKVICFKCGIDHIKARYHNSEINCPFCRGDLFGWMTINYGNSADIVDSSTPQYQPTNNLNTSNTPIPFEDYDNNIASLEPVNSTLMAEEVDVVDNSDDDDDMPQLEEANISNWVMNVIDSDNDDHDMPPLESIDDE